MQIKKQITKRCPSKSDQEGLMSEKRTGEKWGWIGGWIGTFLWMPILAAVILIQRGPLWSCYLALICSLSASVLIFLLAPWRFPDVSMWKLMLPLYVLMMTGVLLFVLSYEEIKTRELIPLLPMVLIFLLPFFIIGKRRWRDGEQN